MRQCYTTENGQSHHWPGGISLHMDSEGSQIKRKEESAALRCATQHIGVGGTNTLTYVHSRPHASWGGCVTKREGIKNSHWAKRLHNGGREGGKGGKGTGGRARIVRTECGEIEHGILVSNRYGSCESTADGTFPVIYE